MDPGLKEALALVGPNAGSPTALETMIDIVRQYHGIIRHAQDPTIVENFAQRARKTGREISKYLRPGGELRERLLTDETISEENWERLCGPRPSAEWQLSTLTNSEYPQSPQTPGNSTWSLKA